MATMNELATRMLQKLGVIEASEEPAAADLQKAVEKIRAAQYALEAEGLVRWTLADVPNYAQEPLVMMAAFLGADDFKQERDPSWMAQGLTMVQRGVNNSRVSTVHTEYF